ncbi:hypothetical protein LZ023_36915 (plasmid) [Pseudomonas silvicola]|nr:hypothetical protein LZ023_36915 [Pseudomonas silvicola]
MFVFLRHFGDNFSNPELVQYAEQLVVELVLVPGVARWLRRHPAAN